MAPAYAECESTHTLARTTYLTVSNRSLHRRDWTATTEATTSLNCQPHTYGERGANLDSRGRGDNGLHGTVKTRGAGHRDNPVRATVVRGCHP